MEHCWESEIINKKNQLQFKSITIRLIFFHINYVSNILLHIVPIHLSSVFFFARPSSVNQLHIYKRLICSPKSTISKWLSTTHFHDKKFYHMGQMSVYMQPMIFNGSQICKDKHSKPSGFCKCSNYFLHADVE